jgi:hypothetical protein
MKWKSRSGRENGLLASKSRKAAEIALPAELHSRLGVIPEDLRQMVNPMN